MPFSKQEIFDELSVQRPTARIEWLDPDMIGCHSFRFTDHREEPGFNLLFSRAKPGDPEFDYLQMWFRMTNPPSEAIDWCRAQAPYRQFASMFLHEGTLQIRHALLVPSASLDKDTFIRNYWAFGSTLVALLWDLDNTNLR